MTKMRQKMGRNSDFMEHNCKKAYYLPATLKIFWCEPCKTIFDVLLMVAPHKLPPKAYKYKKNEEKKGEK